MVRISERLYERTTLLLDQAVHLFRTLISFSLFSRDPRFFMISRGFGTGRTSRYYNHCKDKLDATTVLIAFYLNLLFVFNLLFREHDQESLSILKRLFGYLRFVIFILKDKKFRKGSSLIHITFLYESFRNTFIEKADT